ncbi:MAG: FAD-dependent oxidoreductase [Caulobacter sp.]|nr:FAD-dependent oxidoreductase [Caulobacter sp.]
MTSLKGRTVQVAGAGVLGLAIAGDLAEAGARVTVFDPEPLGRASAVAAGMLAPVFESILDPVAADHFELLMAARDAWPDFARRNGIALHRSGAIYRGDKALRARAEMEARGLACEDRTEGLYSGDDWRVDAGPALQRLRRVAEAQGVAFRRDRLIAPAPEAQTIAATGSEKVGWAPESHLISAIKGQILRANGGPLKTLSDGPVLRRDGGYIAPGHDGGMVGATMQPGRTDLEPDEAMGRLLTDVFPDLVASGLEGETRVGIRGAAPDGLPLVGPSTAPGVWLALGTRRNGWLLAPLVASIIRAYLAGDDPGPWAKTLDARRFAAPTLEA